MIDLVIALCVLAFFAATWSAGRYLPRALACGFPIAVVIAVGIIVSTVGVSGVRDWLMAGLVICVTGVVAVAGCEARKKAGRAERG